MIRIDHAWFVNKVNCRLTFFRLFFQLFGDKLLEGRLRHDDVAFEWRA